MRTACRLVVVAVSLAVTASAQTPQSAAIFVKDGLIASGVLTADSFSSTNLPLFPGGVWNPSNRLDHGDIVSLSTNSSVLNLTNAQIRGSVHTPANWLATSANTSLGHGSIGDNAWVNGSTPGIEMTPTPHALADSVQAISDPNLPGPLVWLPLAVTGATIGGVTYKYVISSASPFFVANLDGSLYVNGTNCRLLVQSSISLISTGQITIPFGKRLSMYVTAQSASISGNGVVNSNASCTSFQYFGLPSNISLSLGANASFLGLIYAPEADFALGGGSANTYDFTGCAVTRSFMLNGNYNFHFDEALNSSGPFPPWIAVQPQSQTVLAGQTATFSISAGGGQPINYRWQHYGTNIGTNIPAATMSTLIVTNAAQSNAGPYTVVITNAYGSITSAPAMLSVYSTAAATLSALFDSISNQCQISIAGVAGFNYAIQASSNLSDWVALLTNSAPFTFTDMQAGGLAQRFYRAVYLP